MTSQKSFRAALVGLFALLATALPQASTPAFAGCGCDHPPPAFAPVMPPFGSAGATLRLHMGDIALEAGTSVEVTFRATNSWFPFTIAGQAVASDTVEVVVPSLLKPGPVKITVTSQSGDQVVFDDDRFTALPLPRRMPEGDAVVMIEDLAAAVGRDGTLYIPVDLQDVLDPTQFAFLLTDLPVRFTHEDVTFYNRDGVDLTIFTLTVADPTERRWGSYFGWDVEEDAGIVNTVYEHKVASSLEPGQQSDLLTYWRHEFHTYAKAHEPDGSHAVDANGFHPDSTLHVDHDQLVIAIRGTIDGNAVPAGGAFSLVDLVVSSVVDSNPIEPDVMQSKLENSTVYVSHNAALADLAAAMNGSTASIAVEESGSGGSDSSGSGWSHESGSSDDDDDE